jgi:pimeloyl-ACP methyl ester carboxylesterase
MAHLTLPHGTIELTEDGPADAPAVVLVHGYSVDEALWAPVVGPLVAAGLRVLRPTLPLGSHRTPLGREATPRGVARLLADLLDELRLDDVTLVGNDTGGAICQFLLDERPERVGRLVLTNCDAFDRFPPFPFDLLFLRLSRAPALLHATLRLGHRTRLTHALFGLLTSRGLPRAQVDAWVAPYLADPAIRAETDAFLRAVDPQDLLAVGGRLHRFDRPVRLVWGAEDRFFHLAHARRLAAAFPHAELVEVPGAKTFVMHDAPERVAAEIAAFAPAPALRA